YSAKMMSAALAEIPEGVYRAEDFLDDDGITATPQRIAVTIRIRRRRAEVDFTGSAPQCEGSVNAVAAITQSAVFYVFRCLLDEQVPATSGLMRPIRVIAPEGTIVNARLPAAVAGGNVETSQRIVDTLLLALARAIPSRIPSASQGTMNNLTFGGADSRHGGAPFAYYETIAGGTGAGPGCDGRSATHSHMTNTLNTPVEVLEHVYPVRVHLYALRHESGGRGKFRGGDGIIREIEMLVNAQVALLSDRRKIPPYGLSGGSPGAVGTNDVRTRVRAVLAARQNEVGFRRLPSKCSFHAPAGTLIRIQTPGGGGWGVPEKKGHHNEAKK
ncbi:MAG: 5-oxoprolinase (ATP-hydrolyzing), partial [Candidatus Acidoferrum typicum]|nr:5-oxoprolinase (ATP-hydrolyzing) [Candidatus Acidoferrum typicum]